MERILVTGGAGFLGSYVCEYFNNKGYKVVAYDNLTKYEINRANYNADKVRNYNVKFLHEIGVPVVVADIRDYETLKKAVVGCDIIIHCAAQPAMTISMENPLYDFNVNVKGLLNILELCRLNQIGLINCSTIHVYGMGINKNLMELKDMYVREPQTINEDDILLSGELTPLHASKFAAETYVRTYIDSYGIDAITFRLTGIYGDRQIGTTDHSWMSLLAIKTLLQEPIPMIGTGKQVRDPIFAKDVVDAMECWINNGRPSGVVNIGGSTENIISILQYFDLLYKITGLRSKLLYEGQERTGDLYYFVCDIKKAEKLLNWKPKTALYEGVGKMVSWLENNMEMFGV